MNERYLFRGKRLDNGEWVEGFYSVITKGAHLDPIQNGCYITTFKVLENGEIILTGAFEVDPATVGQCTGRRDKNGTLIFEGDILCCIFGKREMLKMDIANTPKNCVVSWNEKRACFELCVIGSAVRMGLDDIEKKVDAEIIGSIHDNTESLGTDV